MNSIQARLLEPGSSNIGYILIKKANKFMIFLNQNDYCEDVLNPAKEFVFVHQNLYIDLRIFVKMIVPP